MLMSRGFVPAWRIGWAGWGRQAANHQLRARERGASSEPRLPPPGRVGAGLKPRGAASSQSFRPLGGRPWTMSRPRSRSSCGAVRAEQR